MAIGNKLFALAEREFKRNTSKTPAREKFRGLKLNISKYDETWDRRRGAAARMMGVILREGDEALLKRVGADASELKAYSDAPTWLQREAEHLRRHVAMLELAAGRLTTVLERCRARETDHA